MRKRMAWSLDLSKLIRARSVYHMSLCKANWGVYATMVCPYVQSPGFPERESEKPNPGLKRHMLSPMVTLNPMVLVQTMYVLLYLMNM